MNKPKRFNPSSSQSDRSCQAWQILVGVAMNRQTITYAELARLMFGRKAAGVLAKVLARIHFYCRDMHLPLLNLLVVGKGRGTPGLGLPSGRGKLDEQRESVYECDWYDIAQPDFN